MLLTNLSLIHFALLFTLLEAAAVSLPHSHRRGWNPFSSSSSSQTALQWPTSPPNPWPYKPQITPADPLPATERTRKWEYVFQGTLGKGVAGTAYIARRKEITWTGRLLSYIGSTHHDVAIKLSQVPGRHWDRYVKRLEEDLPLQKAVSKGNKNIVQVKEGFANKTAFRIGIVMEPLLGGSLQNAIRNDFFASRDPTLNAGWIQYYGGIMISTIGYLRDQNLAHGDVHANNWVFDSAGHLKLIDLDGLFEIVPTKPTNTIQRKVLS